MLGRMYAHDPDYFCVTPWRRTGIKAKCPHGPCQTQLNLRVCVYVCVCVSLSFNQLINLLWPLVGEAYKLIQCKITKGPGSRIPGA